MTAYFNLFIAALPNKTEKIHNSLPRSKDSEFPSCSNQSFPNFKKKTAEVLSDGF